MRDIIHDPLLALDNLLRTLMMTGAILITGLVIARPNSWVMNIAMLTLIIGFLSFMLASQFLVTIEMGDEEVLSASERAKDLRLAIPFIIGHVAYIAAGISLCAHFIVT